MVRLKSRLACRLGLALLAVLLLSAPAGAIVKVCYITPCCHDCDYYSDDGVWLYNITWCGAGRGCSP
jgi:hypothetical protein